MTKQQIEAERLGWRFTIREMSAGAYEVVAADPKGRRVSTQCSEPNLASTVEAVAADALQLAGPKSR
jgi:hypothetical protein